MPRSNVAIAPLPVPLPLAIYQSSAGLRVGHLLVEESAQTAVVDRVEVLADIDIHDPAQTLSRQGAPKFPESPMDRAIGPEAIGTAEEVLLIDRRQQHLDCPLRQPILEGRD